MAQHGHNAMHFEAGDQAQVQIGDRYYYRLPPASNIANAQAQWLLRFAGQLTRVGASATDAHELINRMSPYEPRRSLNRIFHRRHDGTTQWLTTSVAWISWTLEPPSSEWLWLAGKIGCGKTFAMASAVKHLLSEAQSVKGKRVLHYFFSHPHNKAIEMFRSFAKQLVQGIVEADGDCQPYLIHDLELCFGQSHLVPELGEVVAIIKTLASHFTGLILCIDGVEECDSYEQEQIWKAILDITKATATKVLLACRNETSISRYFPRDTLCMQLDRELLALDIQSYIDSQLGELAGPYQVLNDSDLREKVRATLMAGSKGMFLWVHLQLEILADLVSCEGGDSPAAVEAALGHLPPTLEDTYIQCLGRKRNGKLVFNLKVLQWCMGTQHPLSVDQVREMLAIDPRTGERQTNTMPSAEYVVRSGVSLVSLEDDKKLLVPTHESARMFFFSQSRAFQEGWPAMMNSIGSLRTLSSDEWMIYFRRATLEIAAISIAHIKARTRLHVQIRSTVKVPSLVPSIPGAHMLEMLPTQLRPRWMTGNSRLPVHMPAPSNSRKAFNTDADVFLDFAIATWLDHTREATITDPVWQEFRSLAMQPMLSWKIHPWTMDQVSETAHRRGLFAFAVSQNHQPLLQILARQSDFLPSEVYNHVLPGNDLLPALHVAAKAGFAEVVSILLKLPKVDINNIANEHRRSALHYAALNGHIEVAKAILVRQDVNVNSQDIDSRTPLSLASEGGHQAVVQLLLSHDNIQPNLKDMDGHTPLWWATRKEHTGVVESLLQCNDVDAFAHAQTIIGNTAEMDAAALGRDAMVRLFIKHHQFSPYRTNNLGESSTLLAARYGHEAVLTLLLAAGARADDMDSKGQTPLSAAVQNKHFVVARHLLEDHHVTLDDSSGLLLDAMAGCQADMVELLVEFGALVNLSERTRSEIHLEAQKYLLTSSATMLQILRLLLRHYAVDVVGSSTRMTSLGSAAWQGNETLVKILLAIGHLVDEVDSQCRRTALMWAMRWKGAHQRRSIVKQLIDRGAALNVVDCKGQSVLTLAAREGHEDTVRTLIDRGATLNTVDDRGRTPLMVAAENGHGNVVRVLLEHRPLLDVVDDKGWTALMLAARHHHADVVNLLVKAGAAVDLMNNRRGTALMLAAARTRWAWETETVASENVVKALVDSGAALNLTDWAGRTAFMLAVKSTNAPAVTTLVRAGASLDMIDGTSVPEWAQWHVENL